MRILTLDVFLNSLILSIVCQEQVACLMLGLSAHRKVVRQGVIRLRISKGDCMLYVIALISLDSVFCHLRMRYDSVTSFCKLLAEHPLGLRISGFNALVAMTFILLTWFVSA